MNPIKKGTILKVNVGVWVAALTSATAVAYAASRPASLPTLASGPASEHVTECGPAAVLSVSQPTVYMPDDRIVSAHPVSEAP